VPGEELFELVVHGKLFLFTVLLFSFQFAYKFLIDLSAQHQFLFDSQKRKWMLEFTVFSENLWLILEVSWFSQRFSDGLGNQTSHQV